MGLLDTLDQTRHSEDGLRGAATPLPGLVLIFSAGEPHLVAVPLVDGALELGRASIAGVPLADASVSRRHARVSFDGRRWFVRDLGSRNGTMVDGNDVEEEYVGTSPRVLRMGDTLLLISADIRRFVDAVVEMRGEVVMGPTLREAWSEIGRAARYGDALHITGESGSGKELAARAFHDAGPTAGGPFVAVNCATIPEGVAERLLFGARKGAYSGATADTDGFVQAADGGTLFLDEIGELDPAVQAKLLRVLETKEVMALGAARPRRVELRVCSATHKSLRAEVAEKRFREDLYFRIGRPEVAIPPLRERPEEIPWLIDRELRRLDVRIAVDAGLVESCLLRPWPGNVRELLGELRTAAREAVENRAKAVGAKHLSTLAGSAFAEALAEARRDATLPVHSAMRSREEVEEALKRSEGNVSRAARLLGMHRTQLRRWLSKNALDPKLFATGPATESVVGVPEEDDDERE